MKQFTNIEQEDFWESLNDEEFSEILDCDYEAEEFSLMLLGRLREGGNYDNS